MNQTLEQQKIQEKYDAIIVGAGNGGLAAAAKLALSGAKVLLIEQHNLPGGFATSFVRGRFEFETSLHELCDYGPEDDKGGVRNFFDKINLDAEFIRVPEAYKLILTDEDQHLNVRMPFGIEEFIDTLDKEVPGSRESVENFFKLGEEIHNAVSYIGKSRGNPDQGKLIKEFPNFLKTAAYSVDEVQEALNIPEKARAILNAYWCYLGIPTSRLNSTIFTVMVYLYIRRGAYVPKFRSHEYTSALDDLIRKSGGRIEYNTRVGKILVEDGKVKGIETEKGEKIQTNHIISNASPTLTYNKLIYPKSEVPEIAFKEVNARIHGTTGFVVYMGLDKTAEELGLEDYSYFIYPNNNTDEIYDSLGELKAPNAQATIVLNNAVPDCSPPGTCIISITTLFQPEVWYDVKPEEYFDLKNKIAEELIIEFEKATGTQIRDHIEEIEVATPQTYARYTRTYEGIIYGYEAESWDSFLPRLMCMDYDHHIEGLELTGGFGKRCHGYSSSIKDGETAGLLTLRDLIEGGELNE